MNTTGKIEDSEITNLTVIAMLKERPAIFEGQGNANLLDVTKTMHKQFWSGLYKHELDSGVNFFRHTILDCYMWLTANLMNNCKIFFMDYRGIGGKDEAEVLIKFIDLRLSIKCHWLKDGNRYRCLYTWKLSFTNKQGVPYVYQGSANRGNITSSIVYISDILVGEGYDLIRMATQPSSARALRLKHMKALYDWLKQHKYMNDGEFKVVYDNHLHSIFSSKKLKHMKDKLSASEWDEFKELVSKAEADIDLDFD